MANRIPARPEPFELDSGRIMARIAQPWVDVSGRTCNWLTADEAAAYGAWLIRAAKYLKAAEKAGKGKR